MNNYLHQLEWTPEKVKSYWDYIATQDYANENYFAKQVGKQIVEFIKCKTPVAYKDILDFGSGPGYLVEYLLSNHANVYAVDYSQSSIDASNKSYLNHSGWEGAKVIQGTSIPWEDNMFDIVFCLETIEHILDDELNSVLNEIFRVTRKGGVVLFTTPNNEDLSKNQMLCPDCGAIYHKWQHVRYWTPQSLSYKLAKTGFLVEFCQGMNMNRFIASPSKHWQDLSVRYIINTAKKVVKKQLDILFPRPFPETRYLQSRVGPQDGPHLVAVAVKP